MTTDDDSCHKVATVIINKLKVQCKTEPDILENLRDLIVENMVPVLEEVRAAAKPMLIPKSISPKKTKKDKKSSRPNYYAFFHSICSPKGTPYLWSLYDYQFKFQPNPEKLGKQKDMYMRLIDPAQADLLERVQSFSPVLGDLSDVVKFVEAELKVSQMTRTAIVWNLFMNQNDRDRFSTWYKKAIDGDNPIEMKPHQPKITAPPIKITALIRNPKAKAKAAAEALIKTDDDDQAIYDGETEETETVSDQGPVPTDEPPVSESESTEEEVGSEPVPTVPTVPVVIKKTLRARPKIKR